MVSGRDAAGGDRRPAIPARPRSSCATRCATRSSSTPGASTPTRPAGSSSATGRRPRAASPCASRATRNEDASPLRYRIHADDLLRLTLETDDADEVFWAIVHSHVRSPARPSPTDIGAAQYPDALYILVSLADAEADPVTGERSVRGWRIVDGAVHEVELRREG